jgi:hypothetical protein
MQKLGIGPKVAISFFIMKFLPVALLVLACAFPLRADNWLQNGDFADGLDHWRGNGRAPADMASGNPFDKPDPFTSKGLILPLRGSDWSRVTQNFRGKGGTSGVLTITYMLSPGLTFSDKLENYTNIPDQLHIDGWNSFNTPLGDWVFFISDSNSGRAPYNMIKPNVGSTGPQTSSTWVKGLTPFADKSLTIAFPPGNGTVVLLKVSFDDKPSQQEN